MILRSLRCSIRAQSPVVLAFLLWSFSSATFVLAQRPGHVLERDSARADTGKQLDLIDIGNGCCISNLPSRVPYPDLPSLGWEEDNRSGRGFDQSRYRGRTLLYTEAEFRRDITDNGFLGLVLFANATTVSGPRSILLIHWNPAVRGGIRIKMNKRSATNIGLNYAQSLHHAGVNLTLGEVF